MRLLRRLILPALSGPWLGGQIGSLMAGHGLNLAAPSPSDVAGILIFGIISFGGLLAVVMPLGLVLSERALPFPVKVVGVVAGATLAGMLIVTPFILSALLAGGDVVSCLALMALFGGLPAAATALVWCALNPDFLRARASTNTMVTA